MSRITNFTTALITLASVSCFASSSKHPNCVGKTDSPAMSGHNALRNHGYVDQKTLDNVDFEKTEVQLLASQPIGINLFKQVYQITYKQKGSQPKTLGKDITVIVSQSATLEECTTEDSTVYLVSHTMKH
ncbi:MAG TPA: hypothetical protein VM901_09765 [Bdellovibrionota bacterium]|jgi:hypothetical protein|nr:hypothetical protein [Bdellovibrionota bacterium]